MTKLEKTPSWDDIKTEIATRNGAAAIFSSLFSPKDDLNFEYALAKVATLNDSNRQQTLNEDSVLKFALEQAAKNPVRPLEKNVTRRKILQRSAGGVLAIASQSSGLFLGYRLESKYFESPPLHLDDPIGKSPSHQNSAPTDANRENNDSTFSKICDAVGLSPQEANNRNYKRFRHFVKCYSYYFIRSERSQVTYRENRR